MGSLLWKGCRRKRWFQLISRVLINPWCAIIVMRLAATIQRCALRRRLIPGGLLDKRMRIRLVSRVKFAKSVGLPDTEGNITCWLLKTQK